MGCILSVDVSDAKKIDVFDTIKHVANSIVEDLSGVAGGIVEDLSGVVSSVVEDLSGVVSSAVEDLSGLAEGIVEGVSDAVEDLSGTLHSASTPSIKEKNISSTYIPTGILNIKEKLKKHTT